MVHIITDTTACIDPEYAGLHHVPVLPQIINFGNESFYEGRDLNLQGFMQRLRSSPQLPKTAAPPPELFTELYRRLVPSGEGIISIHPSSEISGTVRSAQVAAMEFPGADIRVIDTRMVAGPLATLVKIGVSLAESGVDIDTIEIKLRALIPRCRIYFVVDTLEYLAKGGRIGAASALLGGLLQVKPILSLEDGRVGSFEKERTHQRAINRLKQIVLERYPKNGEGYLSVMHASAPEQARAFVAELCSLLPVDEIPIYDLPPAIVVHGGPGILAAGFFE